MPTHNQPPLRTAVVLSCAGAPDGDLGIVRALGRQGVPVHVVSEYADPPVSKSRYCREFHVAPGFTSEPGGAIAVLLEIACRLGEKPVLIPSADPDLQLVSRWRNKLDPHFEIPIASPELVRKLTEKHQFAELAAEYGFPVPATHTFADAGSLDDLARSLTYPVIVKPARTPVWTKPEVQKIVGSRKALITHTREEFLRVCRPLLPFADDLLVQDYIPGDDQQIFEMQAYFDRQGKPLAWFTGRKIRTSPPAVGSGCFVESAIVDEMAQTGLRCLESIGYTGLVDLDFKRDPATGRFLLIEVNPRTTAWNLLPTACGVNFPYIAYSDLTGMPPQEVPMQREGLRYLHFANDFRAFLQYRRNGEWTIARYLRSLLERPLVFQLLAADDLRPLLAWIARAMTMRIRGMFGKVGVPCASKKTG